MKLLASFPENGQQLFVRAARGARVVEGPVVLHEPARRNAAPLFGTQCNDGVDIAERHVAQRFRALSRNVDADLLHDAYGV